MCNKGLFPYIKYYEHRLLPRSETIKHQIKQLPYIVSYYGQQSLTQADIGQSHDLVIMGPKILFLNPH